MSWWMRKKSFDDYEAIAMKILDGWKVRDPELTRRLAVMIQRDGKEPKIKVFWNKKTEQVDFEVLK